MEFLKFLVRAVLATGLFLLAATIGFLMLGVLMSMSPDFLLGLRHASLLGWQYVIMEIIYWCIIAVLFTFGLRAVLAFFGMSIDYCLTIWASRNHQKD